MKPLPQASQGPVGHAGWPSRTGQGERLGSLSPFPALRASGHADPISSTLHSCKAGCVLGQELLGVRRGGSQSRPGAPRHPVGPFRLPWQPLSQPVVLLPWGP